MRTLCVSIAFLTLGIVAGTAHAVDSFFDVFTELSVFTAPPYPSGPHQGNLAHMSGAGGVTVDGLLRLGVAGCIDNTSGADLPTDLTGGDGAPGTGNWAVDSFFDITYRVDLGGGNFAVDSFFDVFVELETPSGTPGQLVPIDPSLPADDPKRYFDTFFVDSFFDITYEVEFNPGVRHTLHLNGQVPAGLRLTNVGVPSVPSTDSFFDIWVEVHQDTAPDLTQPVLALTQTGTFGSTVAVEATPWGAVKALYRE